MTARLLQFAPKPAEPEGPHLSGKARCIACKHDWIAVAPIGTTRLECPACGTMKGAYRNVCWPDGGGADYRECACGNDLFVVERTGILCANCGTRQIFEDCFP